MTYTALSLKTYDGDDEFINLIIGRTLQEVNDVIVQTLASNYTT